MTIFCQKNSNGCVLTEGRPFEMNSKDTIKSYEYYNCEIDSSIININQSHGFASASVSERNQRYSVNI